MCCFNSLMYHFKNFRWFTYLVIFFLVDPQTTSNWMFLFLFFLLFRFKITIIISLNLNFASGIFLSYQIFGFKIWGFHDSILRVFLSIDSYKTPSKFSKKTHSVSFENDQLIASIHLMAPSFNPMFSFRVKSETQF